MRCGAVRCGRGRWRQTQHPPLAGWAASLLSVVLSRSAGPGRRHTTPPPTTTVTTSTATVAPQPAGRRWPLGAQLTPLRPAGELTERYTRAAVHSLTTSQYCLFSQCLTVLQSNKPHCIKIPQSHSITVLKSQSLTDSLPHSLKATKPRSPAASLCESREMRLACFARTDCPRHQC